MLLLLYQFMILSKRLKPTIPEPFLPIGYTYDETTVYWICQVQCVSCFPEKKNDIYYEYMTLQRQNKLLSLLLAIVVLAAGVVLFRAASALISEVSACCYPAECGNCGDSMGSGSCSAGDRCQQGCCVPESDPN